MCPDGVVKKEGSTWARWLMQWAIGTTVLALLTGCSGVGSKQGLAVTAPDWVIKSGAPAEAFYILIVLGLIAAIIERIVETVIVLGRGEARDLVEAGVADADRRWKADRKSEDTQDALRDAEEAERRFKARTRQISMLLCLTLGFMTAIILDLPVMETLLGPKAGTTISARIGEVVIVGMLVAGGAQPLHDIIGGIQKGVKNLGTMRRAKFK